MHSVNPKPCYRESPGSQKFAVSTKDIDRLWQPRAGTVMIYYDKQVWGSIFSIPTGTVHTL